MERKLSKLSSGTFLKGSGCLSRPEMVVRPSEVGCPVKQFSHVWPPTSEGHNFLVRIPIWVFFDSMENPLSQDCSHVPVEDIVQSGMLVQAS